jgi:hypothetical protein
MPRGRGYAYTDETREKILHTLRTNVPFIALAAEANGVSRHTVNTWMLLGRDGDERYGWFYLEVHQIRADFMLKHAQELLSADRETAERAKQRNWLLMRLDRAIFDPPHQIYEKAEPERATPEKHAPSPSATDPAAVAKALAELAIPLTSH